MSGSTPLDLKHSMRSKDSVIPEALAEFIVKKERQTQRLQRTEAALVQLAAGQVVNGDEVMTWVSTWGNDDEKQPPRS